MASIPPSSHPPACPFCHPDEDSVRASSTHALAVADRFPLNPGHTLVVPRDHAESLFDLRADILADVWALVSEVRRSLDREFTPDGFNIGVNDRPAAGQTVPHAHVHVIPRFMGDTPDPRGGIRWVLPAHAPYWDP